MSCLSLSFLAVSFLLQRHNNNMNWVKIMARMICISLSKLKNITYFYLRDVTIAMLLILILTPGFSARSFS